jgi:hypothetical protein
VFITFIAATRAAPDEFWNSSPLGLSIKRLLSPRVLREDDVARLPVRYSSAIAFRNNSGLPEIFNKGIDHYLNLAHSQSRDAASKDNPDLRSEQILVFCHDDIWIDDSQIGEHLISAIGHFDIAGVAGCETRVSNQAAWSFQDPGCSVPVANASGMIAHGTHPSGEISYYGPSCRPCELLDGVFIAVRLNTFQRYPQLRFDCQFSFHFYDIDFCRTALLMGLRMGTWPIAITHSSKGSYKGALWQESYESYIAKWGE